MAYAFHAASVASARQGPGTEGDRSLITPQQMRMARAGLAWTLIDLAKRAEVNPNTLSRYERGQDTMASILRRVEIVLREAGVTFNEDGKTATVQVPVIEQRKTKRHS